MRTKSEIKAVIQCPVCRALRVNRRNKSCGKCGVGLKYGHDFVYEGDWYHHEKLGWISYDQLDTLPEL